MKNKVIRVITSDGSFSLLRGQLNFLKTNYEVIAVSSPGPYVKENEVMEGVPIECIEMERHISIIKDIKALFKLYALFKREKPFIVHSITPKAGLLSMTASYFARVPHRIHTFTGLIFPTKKGLFQKLLIYTDRLLCLFATKIFPEGEGVKKELINYRITTKPLHVIANGNVNGINVGYFSPEHFSNQFKNNLRKELNIEKNDFVFIFIGRLVKDKGVNELVDVFDKLNETIQNVKLLLVGEYEKDLDPLKEDTISMIESNKNIISTGWVDDVRPFFSISDCLTFPSYREGFPNVVIQAGAMGIPCIVTNISGCNEIIIEGKNGTIIPVKNKDLLYQQMLGFYNEKNRFDAKICRDLIVKRYEQKFVWNAILSEYKKLK